MRIRARLRGRRERLPAAARASETTAPATEEAAPASGKVDASGDPVLVVRDVRKNFSGVRALAGVDLSLGRGEILGLIGPNGSGKTTLLNVLAGELPLDEGSVTLGGGDVTGLPAHVIAGKGMVRTFQNIRLFPGMSVRENVLAAANKGVTDADLDRLLARFELGSVWDLPAGQLAYGIQRKVEIARAVVRRPLVLLLDEPAAGMNEAESETLLGMIGSVRDELGCSVVVIDHDLRLILRLCERIQVLNEGATIAGGPPDQVARDPRVIEAYLGREHEARTEERRIIGGE